YELDPTLFSSFKPVKTELFVCLRPHAFKAPGGETKSWGTFGSPERIFRGGRTVDVQSQWGVLLLRGGSYEAGRWRRGKVEEGKDERDRGGTGSPWKPLGLSGGAADHSCSGPTAQSSTVEREQPGSPLSVQRAAGQSPPAAEELWDGLRVVCSEMRTGEHSFMDKIQFKPTQEAKMTEKKTTRVQNIQ
ncbi:unnamed protein product, partial [Menidia menidia]